MKKPAEAGMKKAPVRGLWLNILGDEIIAI
jgi:hypothetical protein